MKPMNALPCAVVLLSLCAALPTHAQISALPPVQTQGDIRYLSGGVGADETAAIKAETSRYALTLLFAAKSDGNDAYLASIPVSIQNSRGTQVLSTVTDGPYLLVNLVPGSYKVSASYAGIERTLNIDLKTGVPLQRSLVWPQVQSRAVAAPVASIVTRPDSVASLPMSNDQGGVPYLTGGIGLEESQAIKAQQGNYALALTFAVASDGANMFLASVPVKIVDTTGTVVLDVTTTGPYLLTDLPPGRYEIVTSHAGREQRANVTLQAGGSIERAFVWPAQGSN